MKENKDMLPAEVGNELRAGVGWVCRPESNISPAACATLRHKMGV